MRNWLEVYDTTGVKVAFIEAFTSGNTSVRLDESGTFDLTCVVQQNVVDYLVRDNTIVLYGQDDNEPASIWIQGVIVKPTVQETGDSISIKISGRDLMEELRWKTVGLGRTYNAKTVQTIMSDLVSLVPGWSASVDSANMSKLQTARFDGTQVLSAMLKSAEQLGIHVRNGTTARTVEIGAFGVVATTARGDAIRAIKPPSSISRELYDNDAVLLVDSISLTEDGDKLVNWAIPMGAGTGSAATTLSNTTYRILNVNGTLFRDGSIPYFPIYRRDNGFGIAEYYIDASSGGTQHQDTLSFKEIGPIANSTLAKQLASDALANACIESLKRTRTALKSFTLTVRKMRATIRPGDLIHLTYRGKIPTGHVPTSTRPELVYIDVDQDLWVMGVSRNFSDSGMTYTLVVNTIDQQMKDDTDILVELLDRSEVTNLSVQNVINNYPQSGQDMVQWGDQAYFQKAARFPLFVSDDITEIIGVKLTFFTKPLTTPATFDHFNGVDNTTFYDSFAYQVRESVNYPRSVSILINGVDVTVELEGPWDNGNASVSKTLDISPYILNAAGGIYQTHLIEFRCATSTGYDHITVGGPAGSLINISHGVIYCNTNIKAYARPY